MKKISINNEWSDISDINKCYIITCVAGEGYIYSKDVKHNIKKGDSYLIPASLGRYDIYGHLDILKSYPTN